jgi:hypothetical protein
MASMMSRLRLKSEKGAELVEFAFVLPLLLFVVVGIIDFGFTFQRYEVVTNAAREGARIGVLPGYAATDACQRALDYLTNGGVTTTGSCPTPTNPTIVVTKPYSISMGTGTPTPPSLPGVKVDVLYTSPYLFLGPIAGWFGGSFTSVPLRGIAIMRCEVASCT